MIGQQFCVRIANEVVACFATGRDLKTYACCFKPPSSPALWEGLLQSGHVHQSFTPALGFVLFATLKRHSNSCALVVSITVAVSARHRNLQDEIQEKTYRGYHKAALCIVILCSGRGHDGMRMKTE